MKLNHNKEKNFLFFFIKEHKFNEIHKFAINAERSEKTKKCKIDENEKNGKNYNPHAYYKNNLLITKLKANHRRGNKKKRTWKGKYKFDEKFFVRKNSSSKKEKETTVGLRRIPGSNKFFFFLLILDMSVVRSSTLNCHRALIIAFSVILYRDYVRARYSSTRIMGAKLHF